MGSRRLFNLGGGDRGRVRRELHDELEFHVNQRIEHLVARGMSPAAARAEALRRMGGSLAATERRLARSVHRKQRRLAVRDRLQDLLGDIRYAARGLARRPGFTIAAALTLAIGIGANTAIYSAMDALLFRSLPFRDPGRLMDIVQTMEQRDGTAPWSWPKYAFFRDAQRSYSSLAAYTRGQTTLTGAEPERIAYEEVTASYLRTLGVNVALGRDMALELDAGPGARRVALISSALWQRRFNADPDIVGKNVSLNNVPWEIAGVLPAGFSGLSGRAEVLVNLTARPAGSLEPWSLEFAMIGRLRDGVTPEQAASEARALGPRIYEAFPMQTGMLTTSREPERWSAAARPLDTIRVAEGLRRSLIVLFAAVGLVLLIACVNLANLLLARGMARHQEIALRQAIGARRGRLVRLLLTESVLLAALGGALSLVVALVGTDILNSINPQESLRVQGLEGGIGAVGFESIRLDGRALAFTFAVSGAVALLFGLLPALRATRADLTRDLREGRSSGGTRLGASRRVLVVAEVALALVLLAGSGLMLRTLANLMNVDPGFDARNVLTLRLTVPSGDIAPDSMPGFYEEVQRRLLAVPGVQEVALADCPPLNNGCNGTIMTFADRRQSQTGNAMVGVHWVSPSWFNTLRVPLRRGRLFADSDRLGAPRVVLINEEAARRYFPNEDPVGQRVAVYQGGFDSGAEVIGIVGDVRFGTIDSTARPDVYISYGQARITRMMLFVRTAGDPLSLAPSVRAALREFAPRFPVYDVRSMEERVATASAQTRFSAVLLGAFAAVALLLAAMGIYGVLAFAVAQRSGEIGIRMALGAGRTSVIGMVVREGLLLAVAGAAIGLVVALGATRVMQAMLFGVRSSDPFTYAAIVLVLALAALLASWLPARRAARVDPVTALRS